jgi:hypothetical protein
MPSKDRHLDNQASRKKNLLRSDKAEEFYCFRCNADKKSKLRAEWHTTEGVKIICNGCYGELVAMSSVAPP